MDNIDTENVAKNAEHIDNAKHIENAEHAERSVEMEDPSHLLCSLIFCMLCTLNTLPTGSVLLSAVSGLEGKLYKWVVIEIGVAAQIVRVAMQIVGVDKPTPFTKWWCVAYMSWARSMRGGRRSSSTPLDERRTHFAKGVRRSPSGVRTSPSEFLDERRATALNNG